MSDEPVHRESDEIHESHITHFHLTTTDQEVILSGGEMKPRISETGETEITEVVYDTKLRMTHETAFQLKELLVNSFEDV